MSENKIRKDCFWYGCINEIDECYVSGDGRCQCTKNCRWYVNQDVPAHKAYSMLYNEMRKE